MLTIEDIQSSMREERKEAILARLDLNSRSNWLQADSDAVLLELAKAYHDSMSTIESAAEGESGPKDELIDALHVAFLAAAHEMTNPSAFRQWLAKHKAITIDEDKTARSSKAAWLAKDLL